MTCMGGREGRRKETREESRKEGNTSQPLQCYLVPAQWHLLPDNSATINAQALFPVPRATVFLTQRCCERWGNEEAAKALGKFYPQMGPTQTERKEGKWDAGSLGALGRMKGIGLHETCVHCSSHSNSKICGFRNQHLRLDSVSLSLAGGYTVSMPPLSGKLPEIYLRA